jgi:hypothetical protein
MTSHVASNVPKGTKPYERRFCRSKLALTSRSGLRRSHVEDGVKAKKGWLSVLANRWLGFGKENLEVSSREGARTWRQRQTNRTLQTEFTKL